MDREEVRQGCWKDGWWACQIKYRTWEFSLNFTETGIIYVPIMTWDILTLKILKGRYCILFSEGAGQALIVLFYR